MNEGFGKGGTPTPEAQAAERAGRDMALSEAKSKLDKRLRELDAALQATTNIATRYDIKLRIEELQAIARILF